MTKKKKIIISCANGEVSYDLINYLKKKYYVIGIDTNKFGLAKKICDEFYICPNGSSNKFPSYIERMSKKVESIFLFADEEILNISKNINKLKYVKNRILISDFQTIETCNDKKIFEKKLINYFNFPKNNNLSKAIIKPKIGRGSKNILISKDKKIINFFKKNQNYLVQEFIVGKEFTVDCFFLKDGKLLQSIARERIIKKNVSIVGKIIFDKKINKIVEKISSILKFRGPINIQLMKKKNIYYLIEINPRISGSILFSMKSNFNPFDFQVKYLNNKKFKINKIDYNKYYYRYYNTYV